ncbi:MAG: ribonuclease P protein component [candidate division Zixibacteria bacterium]|nr:ribonuclease P protein component [candidate division Zixibacteria bacterium]
MSSPGKNSLPRDLSLKSRLEIDSLFKTGTRIHGTFHTLIWQPSEQFSYGVFVSRRLGNAVKRNRVKRLFREALRLNRHSLTQPGRMGLIIKSETVQADFSRISQDLVSAIDRVNKSERGEVR